MIAILDDDYSSIADSKECYARQDKARLDTAVWIPLDGNWSNIAEGFVSQKMRTRVWYFFLTDCNGHVKPYSVANQKISLEITILNSDGSHFSEEENGITLWYFIELLILLGFFGANSMRFYRFYRTEETWDLPFLILTIAIFFESMSIFFEWVHMVIYAGNGTGAFVMDVLSQAFGVFAQFIITVLLILIASGWSIDFFKIEELDLYLPMVIMVGIFHVVIVGVGRVNDEDPMKFHDYESIPGWIIMFFRVIFFAVFAYFINKTNSKAGNNTEKKEFLFRFGILGAVYLLALPIIVTISSLVVAPYVRNKLIVLGTLAIQIGASITLTYLLSSKKSKYHQISMKGRTLLPSGKLD